MVGAAWLLCPKVDHRLKLIIEFDGPLADILPVHYLVYRKAAAAVGWAAVDEATFRRLLRRSGRDAALLPGARPTKAAELWKHMDRWVESNESIEALSIRADASTALPTLTRQAACLVVTLGSNLIARQRLLERAKLTRHVQRVVALSDDPALRPTELRTLAGKQARTVIVASTDTLIRAAGAAEIISVGLPVGTCIENRLHQAGASVVMPGLSELADSLQRGAPELVTAGLLPPPVGS